MKSLALIFLLLLPTPLWAAPAVCKRAYVVGLNVAAVAKKKAGISALSSEIFNEIKRRVGCIYNEKPLSFTRALEDLRNHRIDMYAFAFANPEWATHAKSESIYKVERMLLVQKKIYNKDLTVEDYLHNPKLKFAVISGGIFFTKTTEIARLEKENRAVFDPFPDGALELFRQGKVEAVFTSPTYYRRYEKEFDLASFSKLVNDPATKLDLCLFFSNNRVSVKEQESFAKAIEGMRRDGTLKKILIKYVGEDDFEKYYHL
jgi:polar amino acid transport system substrate-binding protein